MAILSIRQLGDPVLRERTAPVERFDESLRLLADDMIETMYAAPGVGLDAELTYIAGAAKIAGALVAGEIDVAVGPGEVAMGPGLEGADTMDEGCLSVRGPYAPTARAARLHVRGQALDGRPVEFDAEGFLARIMQHETDHLEGRLFIDLIDEEARRDVMRQLREQEVSGGRLGRRSSR